MNRRPDNPSTGEAAPRRALALRSVQLGDMLRAGPSLRALRPAWPLAQIVPVGLAGASCFVDRFGHTVGRFHEFAGYPGLPEMVSG